MLKISGREIGFLQKFYKILNHGVWLFAKFWYHAIRLLQFFYKWLVTKQMRENSKKWNSKSAKVFKSDCYHSKSRIFSYPIRTFLKLRKKLFVKSIVNFLQLLLKKIVLSFIYYYLASICTIPKRIFKLRIFINLECYLYIYIICG